MKLKINIIIVFYLLIFSAHASEITKKSTFLAFSSVSSGVLESPNFTKFETIKRDTTVKKSFLKKVWGNTLKSSITFMPVATHTKDPDIFGAWYTAYNYKSIEVAAFSNSYRELTFAIIYKRIIPISEKFSILYGLGAMYGYHGRLKDVGNIPFRNSFLMTGEINPIAGIELDYKISKRFSLHSNVTHAVLVYGVRYLL